jgi:hypothetical protein
MFSRSPSISISLPIFETKENNPKADLVGDGLELLLKFVRVAI